MGRDGNRRKRAKGQFARGSIPRANSLIMTVLAPSHQHTRLDERPIYTTCFRHSHRHDTALHQIPHALLDPDSKRCWTHDFIRW